MSVSVFCVDLYRNISTSLSQEERLEKLMEAAMKVSSKGSYVLYSINLT